MKKGILFLNGEPPQPEYIDKAYKSCLNGEADGVYCTDGAYSYVSDFFIPNAVIGDFDSQNVSEVDDCCEKIRFSRDKDFTDGFLAVKIMAERGYTCLDIYGAYGARPDMAESNYLILALAYKLNLNARFCGEWQTYLVGKRLTLELKKGAAVSVVPFTDEAHILYMKGLRYCLSDYTMTKLADIDSPHYVMGVSNVSEGGAVEIEINRGLALVFIKE